MEHWLQAVTAVSNQEDYVASLKRRIAEREDPTTRSIVQSMLEHAEKRLTKLRQTLKEIDEGDNNA